jgi:hypothetical protein
MWWHDGNVSPQAAPCPTCTGFVLGYEPLTHSQIMLQHRLRLGVGKECCNSQNQRKPLTSLFGFVCNLAESLHHKDTSFHSCVSLSFFPSGTTSPKQVCMITEVPSAYVATPYTPSPRMLSGAQTAEQALCAHTSWDAVLASKSCNLRFKYVITLSWGLNML